MPEEPEKRGVGEAEAICQALKQNIANAPIKGPDQFSEVDEVFRRLHRFSSTHLGVTLIDARYGNRHLRRAR